MCASLLALCAPIHCVQEPVVVLRSAQAIMWKVQDCADGKGRGLFATCDIPAGIDVVSEAPLLIIVSQDQKDWYCGRCLCPVSRPGVHQKEIS